MKLTASTLPEVEIDHKSNRKIHVGMTPGLWLNGKTFWVHDGYEKLMTKESISIHMKEERIHSKVKLYDIYVTNHSYQQISLKLLFMHQLKTVASDHFSFVSPLENVIFHSAYDQVFLVNGQWEGKFMEQATVQPFWNIHTDNIWSSKERGILKYQPMAKGTVVSISSIEMTIPPRKTAKGNSWVISGSDKGELTRLNESLLKNTLAFPFEK